MSRTSLLDESLNTGKESRGSMFNAVRCVPSLRYESIVMVLPHELLKRSVEISISSRYEPLWVLSTELSPERMRMRIQMCQAEFVPMCRVTQKGVSHKPVDSTLVPPCI